MDLGRSTKLVLNGIFGIKDEVVRRSSFTNNRNISLRVSIKVAASLSEDDSDIERHRNFRGLPLQVDHQAQSSVRPLHMGIKSPKGGICGIYIIICF